MSTTVHHQEAAWAAALFTSDLSAQCQHTPIEVATAIKQAIGAHHGIVGCVAEMAAAYGEHPETATRRMRWARTVIAGHNAPAGYPAHCPAADGEATPGGGASLGGRLIEQGYVHARFGGMPVLVGPKLATQLKALRGESHG